MATNNKLQSYTSYIDGQLVQLAGPNSSVLSYQYDQEQRTFYVREAIANPIDRHGATHITQDPIPNASCNTPGLMSANDKCKLDSVIGMRIGVLGFQGAGFPDDGGWMQGDVILAAGSEFISLERVGQIIRFVVDVPSPYICQAEECFQVYWIQDETDVNAIRPPSCGGRLPGVNGYGELKIYVFPESTVVNPNNPVNTLKNKGKYPSLIFKRYDDGTDANSAELDMVLKRNAQDAAIVGWAFTPGATGTPECVWYMGVDDDGNRIDFKFQPNSASGLLGAILYKQHSITKQMAVITGYLSDTLSTNKYKAKWFSMANQEVASTSDAAEFEVTNLQQWDLINNQNMLDAVFGSILTVGQFVDIWAVKCGNDYCYYCKERPMFNVNGMWATLGAVEFGDTLASRSETPGGGTAGVGSTNDVPLVDPTQWGLTNMDESLMSFDGATTLPVAGTANYKTSIISTLGGTGGMDRRYMEVIDDSDVDNTQRPVMLWHRAAIRNALIEVHLARPVEASRVYPPIDILLRAPISGVGSVYATVAAKGSFASGPYTGSYWVKITGAHWHDLPFAGAIKSLLSPYGQVMTYSAKVASTGNDIYLVTDDTTPNVGDLVEILHQEYTTSAARLQFLFNSNGHDIEMVPVVGTLDMGVEYSLSGSGTGTEETGAAPSDFIKDFSAYTLAPTYWQNGDTETAISGIETSVSGFYILNGGLSQSLEYFNVLRIMVIESQVWMWWNNMLIPTVDGTPYFAIEDQVKYGKFGLRLWPGARVRRMIVRSKLHQFSEYTLGQLEMS